MLGDVDPHDAPSRVRRLHAARASAGGRAPSTPPAAAAARGVAGRSPPPPPPVLGGIAPPPARGTGPARTHPALLPPAPAPPRHPVCVGSTRREHRRADARCQRHKRRPRLGG